MHKSTIILNHRLLTIEQRAIFETEMHVYYRTTQESGPSPDDLDAYFGAVVTAQEAAPCIYWAHLKANAPVLYARFREDEDN